MTQVIKVCHTDILREDDGRMSIRVSFGEGKFSSGSLEDLYLAVEVAVLRYVDEKARLDGVDEMAVFEEFVVRARKICLDSLVKQ